MSDSAAHGTSTWHGILASALFVSIMFGPLQRYAGLPVHQILNVLLMILFLFAWRTSTKQGAGWFWGPGKAVVSLLYLLGAATFVVSYLVALAAGRLFFLPEDILLSVFLPIMRLFVIFVIAVSLRPSERGWDIFFGVLIVSGLVEVVVLGAQYFDLPGVRDLTMTFWRAGASKMLTDNPDLRALGTSGNPNTAGCMTMLCLGASLLSVFYGRGLFFRLVVPGASALAMFWANLQWTMSRASLFSVLVAAAAVTLLSMLIGEYKKQAIVGALLIAGLLGFFFLSLDSLPIPDRMKDIFRGTGHGSAESGMSSRVDVWGWRIQEVAEQGNPFTGYGPIPSWQGSISSRFVDNDYIDFYFRAGVLGFLAMVAVKIVITVKTFTCAWHSRTPADMKVAFLLFYMNIIFLVFGLTADITMNEKVGLMIPLAGGLTCAFRETLRRKEAAGEIAAWEFSPDELLPEEQVG